MKDLISIWYEAIQQRPLSDDNIEFVKTKLKADKVEQVVMAESILFLISKDKSHTKHKILGLCDKLKNSDNEEAAATLLLVLGFFRGSDVIENKGAFDFVCSSAQRSGLPAKINSIRVLGRLAKVGNQEASRILKLSAKDSHLDVRDAAQAALKLAGIQ